MDFLIPVLGEVLNVHWKVINSTAVLIFWTPLLVPVNSYEVLFTRDLAAPIDLWHSRSAPANHSSLVVRYIYIF